MSETRYTPEQMRDKADRLYNTGLFPDSAAMLRQAATDAEALAAKDERIAALEQENFEQKRDIERHVERFTQLDGGYKAILEGERGRLTAATAEIARLVESRNEIITRNAEMFKELRQAWPALGRCVQQKEALQDELTAERQKVRELREKLKAHQANAKRDGSLVGWTAMLLALSEMDALALTGDATEGQGAPKPQQKAGSSTVGIPATEGAD